MEKAPKPSQNNNKEKPVNFYEISQERKALRKALSELGVKPVNISEDPLVEEIYGEPWTEINEQSSKFKIADFESKTVKVKRKNLETGEMEEIEVSSKIATAKEALKKQKTQFEDVILKARSGIDYEKVLQETPEIAEVKTILERTAKLRDFRMRRMFENANPKTSELTKKRNEKVLESISREIKENKERLTQFDPIILRQAKILGYKEDLAKEGHICITESTEEDLMFIGKKMVSGESVFLYGPTGTGKTSLAKYALRHFTGKRAKVIPCSDQTRESNIHAKTGIRPIGNSGAMETYIDYGPLSEAAIEGCGVVFDEVDNLNHNSLMALKNVFATKIGDQLDVPGNGSVTVQPGFQPIFTANLKSKKHPNRNDIDVAILREFDVTSSKIRYTPADESYDIILARLLNKDGSIDMSFYDLHTTLPNLCKAMAEIQESYEYGTSPKLAEKIGILNRTNNEVQHSLEKMVMTQGTIQKILSLWMVEKQTDEKEKTFSEFLDQSLKSFLTLEGYPKEDRILAARILVARGFLLTLTAKELDLPEDIFQLNAKKAMRGDDAVEELKKESGAVRHLSLKEVAELDPFHKRAELLRNQAEALLGSEEESADPFLTNIKKRKSKIFGKEKNKTVSEITTTYTNPEGKTESITLDFEAKLQEFISFYQKTQLDLPPDFEDITREIWERNQDEIEKAIAENGFDDMLIIPPTTNLPDLAEKMKMGNGYYFYQVKEDFSDVQSVNVDKPRIILFHHTDTLPEIAEKTGLDIHLNITGEDALKLYQANPEQYLATLEDAVILERKYFEETGKHLSDYQNNSAHRLPASSVGARLVDSDWDPDSGELDVSAYDLANRYDRLGVRPARCFF